MHCQTCHRQLEPLEPIYRMQFGPAISNGKRTSLCERYLEAFVESLKWSSLRDGFRASEPCEVCARPVFNLKRWTVSQVICSPTCRGELDAQPAKRFWTSRRWGANIRVSCLHRTKYRALAHARVAAKMRCQKPTSPRSRDFLSPGRGAGGKNNKRRCRLLALPQT
jgi:hypothetical protein